MKRSQEHSVKVAPAWCRCVYSLKVCFVSFLSFLKGCLCFPSSLAAQNWTDSSALYSYVLGVELCSIWEIERKLFEFNASIRRNNMTSCPEWHSHHHGNQDVGGARWRFGPVRCDIWIFLVLVPGPSVVADHLPWKHYSLSCGLLQDNIHATGKLWGAQLGVWGADLASRCLRSEPNRASVDSQLICRTLVARGVHTMIHNMSVFLIC